MYELQISRLSDEDLRDIGLTSNAVGQLRSIVKSQTNGLNQISVDKKLDNSSNTTHPVTETIENEVRFMYIRFMYVRFIKNICCNIC